MSLIDNHPLRSGLTSRKTPSDDSTRSCDNGSTDVKTALRNSAPHIKVEGPEICELGLLAALDPILDAKISSFNRDSWDNVPFFGIDDSAATRVRSQSCNGSLETSFPRPSSPATSQRTLRSIGSTINLAQYESPGNKTHAYSEANSFRSDRSGSQSPGLSSPNLYDDGDSLFETPKSSTSQLQYQLTPPTPLSAYGAQYFPLGEDSGSPIRGRRQRPAPSPVQPSKEEAEIQCRGRTGLQPTVPDETRLRDSSAQSWVSIDRSRSESASERSEGETLVQLKMETNTEEGAADRYDTPHNDSSASLSTLAKGTDVLEDVFGYNILSRLEADPNHCVHNLKLPKKGRCSRRLKYGNNKIAHIHMDELRSLLPLPHVAAKLEALVPLLFCSRSHLSGAKKRVATWRLENEGADLVRAVCDELFQGDVSQLTDISGGSSLVDKSRVVKEQDIIPPQVKNELLHPFSIDFEFGNPHLTTRSSRPVSYKSTPKQFSAWQPQIQRKHDVKAALLASITHPLREQGDISGYLYVYSTVGDFGKRKIGVTAKDYIQGRMNEWRKKCHRRINLIYPLEDEKVPVPHVYRLEKLVHAELKGYRIVEHGCDCGTKRHKEWFDAKDHHITEVVRRWTEWLHRAPYEKIEKEWVLKKEFQERQELVKACTPYEPPKAEPTPKRKIKNLKGVAQTKRQAQ
ncbi:hypothetical protein MMC19_005697 [Ptychographa xylographoides]|nr:hypothetical protein [Ptychographa xylographoides]